MHVTTAVDRSPICMVTRAHVNDSDGQFGVVRLSNYYSLQASSFIREKLKSKNFRGARPVHSLWVSLCAVGITDLWGGRREGAMVVGLWQGCGTRVEWKRLV